MAQSPGSAIVDQVLIFLANVGASASYTKELQALNTRLAQPLVYGLTAVDGSTEDVGLDLSDMANVPTTLARTQVTEQLELLTPLPNLVVYLEGSAVQQGDLGPFRNTGWVGYEYMATCAFFVNADQPQVAARRAELMATAFDALIERNPSLGGLVELIESESGVEQGSTGPYKDGGAVAAARIRYRVKVLHAN